MRHHDQPLALARIRHGNDGGQRIRPQVPRDHLDGSQRDHLAANLGKALGAALDGDEALGVDGDDVAGVVPALHGRLQHARFLDLEIAEHHVRPAHVQAAAFLDSFDLLQPRLHARQDAADCAELVEHRRIERERRRRLGDAVAFEDAQPEFFHVGLARGFLHRLGAREDVAQRAEVVRVRDARIAIEECVGAEHDGGVHAVDQLGHGAIVQRRRIEIDADAGNERQHHTNREPERVEHREHVEHLVLAPEVDAGGGLGGIRQHVAVGQHDALRHAFGARGEEDGGPIVGLAGHQRLVIVHEAAELVGKRDGRADVIEIDDTHLVRDRGDQLIEPRLLDEYARRYDGLELGRFAARQNIRRTGGEVDHRRDAARRHQRQERHHRAVGVRQHHADRAAFGRERHQLGAEDTRRREQALVGERAGHRVLHGDAGAAVLVGGLDDGLEHRAVGRGGAEYEIGHDAVERRTRRLPSPAALERGIDRKLHRLEHGHFDFREPFAAHLSLGQPAERRLLQALDAHRHDLRIGFVGDHGGAVVDLHQAAGDGDAALRKDDQRIAGLDRIDQGTDRHRLHRIERERARELEERLDPPQPRDADIDGEDRLAIAQRHGEAGIEEAHVVERDDDVRARIGEIVEPFDFNAEQRAVDD